MEKFLLLLLAVVNLAAFCAMGIDKRRARRRQWRIPEKTLFALVLLGGGIGGTMGMYVFRHKTKHWYFRIGFPLITLAEYAGLLWLVARYFHWV